MNKEIAIEIKNLKKQYILGTIGGGTLADELKRKWAKVRGKNNPLTKIGEEELEEHYGESFYALGGINLTIKKGEVVGIIGHNGAGKSTLLKVLSRVTVPTEGTVTMRGRVASMLEVGTGFHPELTGRENIYMNGAILGMTKAEVDEKIEEIIDFSECRQFIDTPVKRYSSGMYVKLAFAVAAHLDAEIMIMDEVLAVGDVKFQKKCLGRMDGAAHNEGKTVLYVSHNMATIRQLCSRCIVLEHGKIIFDGDTESAINKYMNTAEYKALAMVDLLDSKRPSADHGKDFRLKELHFIHKDSAVFFNNEPVRFSVKWSSEINLENVYLRFEVEYLDETPVGMAQTECLGDVKAGENGVWDLIWDISNIVEGQYKLVLDVYVMNEFGTYSSYDHPNQKIAIVVQENTQGAECKTTWYRKSWNSVRLNEIMRV